MIAATSGLKPAKSASSSMHSTPMIVESMSAISMRFRRPAAGTTLASQSRTANPAGSGRSKPISTAVAASRRGVPPRPGDRRVGNPRRGGQHENASANASDGCAARLQALMQHLRHQEGELQACGALSRGSQ